MVVESFIYSVFITVLGMVIVFSFLTFLSFMMITLKKCFKEKKEAIQPVVVNEDIDWIKAAVSTFLAYESVELNRPSAHLWQPQAREEYDPWLTGRRG